MVRPIRFDRRDFQARRPNDWLRIVGDALSTPFFYKAAYLWPPEFVEFLHSDTDLENPDQWKPVRPLGKGGFGMVGLWQRLSRYGTVVDSLAIKQEKQPERLVDYKLKTVGYNGMTKEAMLTIMVNPEGFHKNMVQLRGFRSNRPSKLWRYYLSFAPHGDLRLLMNKYRGWNTYFPEEFLWQIFHGLANAVQTLEKGPFDDMATGTRLPAGEAWLLHLDLKPENIFLDDPVDSPNYIFINYPTVKVGDFGIAQLSSPNDATNPTFLRYAGTEGYDPPVRLLHVSLLAHVG